MTTASELGISEQEFQDALNLETLLNILHRGEDSCSQCQRSPAVFADCDRVIFLCRSCGKGQPSCKNIQEERFKKFEVERFSKKFSGRRRSSGETGKSKKPKRKSQPQKKRRDSISSAESCSESGSGESVPRARQKPRKKTDRRSTLPRRAEFDEEDLFDLSTVATSNPSDIMQFPAGMVGLQARQNLLMQQTRRSMSASANLGGDSWAEFPSEARGLRPGDREMAFTPYGVSVVNRWSAVQPRQPNGALTSIYSNAQNQTGRYGAPFMAPTGVQMTSSSRPGQLILKPSMANNPFANAFSKGRQDTSSIPSNPFGGGINACGRRPTAAGNWSTQGCNASASPIPSGPPTGTLNGYDPWMNSNAARYSRNPFALVSNQQNQRLSNGGLNAPQFWSSGVQGMSSSPSHWWS